MDNEEKFYIAAAIDILNNVFSITKPTQKQIQEMKSLLFNTWLRRDIRIDSRLTDREKMCLLLASQGKTSTEIAEALGITVGVVRNYEQIIINKLGCHNMKQAIAIGIRYGALPQIS